MAGGFDLMRFQKCSDTLIPMLRKNAKWIAFWIFALFVLFYGLDSYSAIRSEARWFEVVREMLMTGDWLHPRINGQAYFDKPLVSYWFAALLSHLSDGRIAEGTVRMPSAIFSLIGLGCIISVARKFYSERTAYLAAWLLLSTYSFIVWGRLAEADMEQTVFIVMAVTVYLHHREKASFWAYFAFWACCAVGAQTKGLAAIVIPPALAVIDCVIRKDFRTHLNWKFFLALIVGGLCLYSIPFVLEAVTSDNYGASGIVLVFRENLMRVFNPWDHKDDPFYVYFLYLPRLLIPWTPFFIFAVIDYVRKLIRAVAKRGTASVEDLSSDTLWLFVSIVFIFVMFSASRSRRSYYILPIVPWCILFTAAWFSEPGESWSLLRKLTDKFLKLVDVLIPWAAGLLIAACVVYAFLLFLLTSTISRLLDSVILWDDLKRLTFELWPFAFLAGIAWLVIWRKSRRKLLREGGEGPFAPSPDPLNRVVPFVAFILFSVFTVVIPSLSKTDSFDADWWFLVRERYELNQIMKRDPDFLKRTAFFGSVGNAEITFYLRLSEPIRMFAPEKLDDTNRTFTSDTVDLEGPDEFRVFLADVLEHGGMVITRGDWVARLEEDPAFRDIVEMLGSEEMIFKPSDLTPAQEHKLDRLREKPGWQDDPKTLRKIRKIENKRIYIFYHLSDSVAAEVPVGHRTWTGLQTRPAEADGTEGTTQP